MKTRTTFTLALATAAALGFGAAAGAQQGYDPDGRYNNDPSYRAPYDYGGYAGPRSVRQLLIAAHEIDDAANYIHRQYDRNNRRPDRREARVSARLAELAASAREFHREVASYRGDSRHTQDDFQRLVGAYDRATDALGRVAERPYVDQGMERIATRLDQTASIYGLNIAEMTRYHGERRYDRDRRDRDDSYRGEGYRGDDNGYRDNGYRQDRDGDVYVPSPPPPPPHR